MAPDTTKLIPAFIDTEVVLVAFPSKVIEVQAEFTSTTIAKSPPPILTISPSTGKVPVLVVLVN